MTRARSRAPTPPTSVSTTSRTSPASPAARCSTAPRSPAPSTAGTRWSRRAWPPSRAAPSTSAAAAAPTSTPRRSAARSPAPCWSARCTRTASTSGATARRSRATTSSGSTATACWPTPSLRIYKPWLDADFVTELGGRTEMSQWLTEHDLPYRDSEEKAYSTDANIWGATHEAKTLEHLDVSLETVEPIMGVKFWDPSVEIAHRGRHRPLRARPPGRHQRQAVRRPGRARARGQHRSAAGTASACPTRSRTGSSRPSRAASTRRPAWRCSGSPTSGCSTRSTTRTPIANYHAEGRRLGRLLYEGRWLDPQALMLRESIQRWIASVVTGEVTLRLRRGEDYTILRTEGRRFSYHPDKLSMERTDERRVRPDRPDRPAHHAQPRHRRLARQARAVRRPAARPGPGARRARHLLGELEAGGGDVIADNPDGRGRRRRPGPGQCRDGVRYRLMTTTEGRATPADPAPGLRPRAPGQPPGRGAAPARLGPGRARASRTGSASAEPSTPGRRCVDAAVREMREETGIVIQPDRAESSRSPGGRRVRLGRLAAGAGPDLLRARRSTARPRRDQLRGARSRSSAPASTPRPGGRPDALEADGSAANVRLPEIMRTAVRTVRGTP